MSDTISFSLNGQTVEAQAGETIWQVATRLGVEIPHLCYSPEADYRADGNCRACMVEIEGERVLAASCIRTPSEGMVVNSASDRARTARKMVFEMLKADQPERETSHDPGSTFWNWASDTVLHRAGCRSVRRPKSTKATRRCGSISTPASIAIYVSGPAVKCR